MRILFISNIFPTPYRPTLGTFNLTMLRALASEHEVRVIAPVPWTDEWQGRHHPAREQLGTERIIDRDGMRCFYPRYYYTPKVLRTRYGSFLWSSIRRTLWTAVEDWLPDVILGYWAHPDGEVAVRFAKLLGIPSVIMTGGSDVLILAKEGGRRRCIKAVLDHADKVVALSEDLSKKLVQLGVDASKISVAYRGVDDSVFHPGDQRESRKLLGIGAEERMLLWVGRMVPVKGLDVLLDACGKLQSRGVAFKLYLLGNGPLRPALEAQCASLGISDSVRFAGAVAHDQLGNWYRAADYTVLSSHSEGIPNVLRESLACGTPFVATRVGGIAEIATDPLSQLIDPGNPSQMADAMERALSKRARLPVTAPNLNQAKERLLEIISPLVHESQNTVRPWWAGRQPTPFALPQQESSRTPKAIARAAFDLAVPKTLLLRKGPESSNAVCLTFDDGPHPEHTPRILDHLSAHGIKAVFFVVGRLAEKYPDIVRRIAAEGHVIGNHCYYHSDLPSLSVSEALGAADRNRRVLETLIGAPPLLHRPPRGRIRLTQMLRFWANGYRLVMWSADPRDFAAPSAEELASRFREYPWQAGDIVLLHDRVSHTATALPVLIESIRARGLGFVSPNEWLASSRQPDRSAGTPTDRATVEIHRALN